MVRNDANLMPKYFFIFVFFYIMKNVIFAFLLLFVVSCGGSGSIPATGAYDTLYAPRYAQHFVVLSRGDTTFLRVNNPWQGASGVSYDYAIDSVGRVVCMSSSHAAFLDTLGAGDRVVGVSSAAYYTNARFAALPDVGYDNSLNVELIVSLKPDVITAYEIAGENSSAITRLTNFGVKPLYVADYLEENPLARAEWVVAFGVLVERMEKGVEIFDGVEKRYNDLKNSIKTRGVEPRRVMLNSPYKGVWYLPGDSSYVVRLVEDAGGQYVARGNADNISHPVSTEVAYAQLRQAEVWLNPSANITTLAQLRGESPLFRSINIPVYNNTARSSAMGGSDFWESGVVRADVVLYDLIKIMHPQAAADHTFYYYKEIR